MLTKRIIPCFDVDNGRVVKGISFVELRDAGDPVELAATYAEGGADELVFLDITASSDNRTSVYELIARTADQIFIPLTVGGGIRSTSDMRTMLEVGADKVSVNTAAVQDPNLISEGAYLAPQETVGDGGPVGNTDGGVRRRARFQQLNQGGRCWKRYHC